LDSDGIPEDEDICPYNTQEEIAKGVYQTGPQKGCPIDNDNDKVPDYRDGCPQNTPLEISNGVDSQGCPLSALAENSKRRMGRATLNPTAK